MAWRAFWQSHHSLPYYTWFESILTPLWSSYLVWTILTNKLILIFVLRDGLKFFLTIISFTAMLHVVWAYFDTIMILLFWLNNLNQQTHINFNSKWWLQVVLDNHFLAAEIHKLNLQFLSYRPVIYQLTLNIPQNDHEKCFYWFLKESYTFLVWKNGNISAGAVLAFFSSANDLQNTGLARLLDILCILTIDFKFFSSHKIAVSIARPKEHSKKPLVLTFSIG